MEIFKEFSIEATHLLSTSPKATSAAACMATRSASQSMSVGR